MKHTEPTSTTSKDTSGNSAEAGVSERSSGGGLRQQLRSVSYADALQMLSPQGESDHGGHHHDHDHGHGHYHEYDEQSPSPQRGSVRSTRFDNDDVLLAVAEGTRVLEVGDSGPAVMKIRRALIAMGILPATARGATYDTALAAAVTRYQASVGIAENGTVDQATFAALDSSYLDYSREGQILDGTRSGRQPTEGRPWPAGRAPASLTNGTHALSSGERDAFNEAISTGVRRDPTTGQLPTFTETVNGQTYAQRVEHAIQSTVNMYLISARRMEADRTSGNQYEWSDINNVAVESKRATDAVFGQYAVGPALTGGTATSSIRDAWAHKERELRADPDVAAGWAEWRVRKIITGGEWVARIDREHGAVQTRAPERAILDRVKARIISSRQADLVLIHKSWPAFAYDGNVFIQRIQNTSGGFTNERGRDYMWQLFQTVIHEYVHTLEHPNHRRYRGGLGAQDGAFTLREGTTDYFTKIAYNNTAITPTLRRAVEGPYHERGVEHDVPELRGYSQAANAEQGAAIIGLKNLCAGFFLGMLDRIGQP